MTVTAPRELVPPQNLNAEESVLGAMLLHPHISPEIQDLIVAKDFYRESHGIIFDAICATNNAGVPADAITVTERLERSGRLKAAGGQARVFELAAIVPASANAPHYARIVKDTATLRRLIQAGGNIARLGWEPPCPIDGLISLAEEHLALVEHGTGSDFVPLTDGLDDLVSEIRTAYLTGVPNVGLPTGFPDLDAALTGLHPGQMIVVAARPAMGKSVLAQNIAENIADSTGTPAALFSLEMSRREIQLRALSRAANIDIQRLRTGMLDTVNAEQLPAAIRTVTDRPLLVEDHPNLTPGELRARAKRTLRKCGLSILVVDYIQLMTPSRSDENRQQEIAQISRSLKTLARELSIPVIAVAQLNRELEHRANKRPSLSDLRDSGAIEQDADVVAFIYRDDYYNPESKDKGVAEIIIAKNRMGPPGTVRLAFNGRGSTFKPIRKEPPDDLA